MKAASRPNILLVCVDQWRGDCLSIDGHPVVHTPWLDQMALEGVRFTRAYSATPTCIAARAALFTGLTQRSHGRVGYQDGVAWNYPVTLAGEFTRHGYQTQAVGKMHVYPERNRVGFQRVVLADGPLHFSRRNVRDYDTINDYYPWLRKQMGRAADAFEHGINCNSYVARPWDKPEHVHHTNFVATKSIEFLRHRDRRRPFFLFVSFHRPHPPYDPPQWAFDQYINAEMPPPPMGEWAVPGNLERLTGRKFDGSDPWLNRFRPDTQWGIIPERLLRRARAGYYGHMTHIDHQLNRLFETLYDLRLEGNTYICFVSDHGEMLGDHGFFRKSVPYEGSARVPLLLRGPEGSGIGRNAMAGEPVELRDVMPTLLDCAGLPVPKTVEGRSVLPLARGEKPEWRQYIHGEHAAFGQSVQWLTDGREKYVWWSGTGREQLFDLANDPNELRDLADSSPERVAPWRTRLVGELEGREEGYSEGGRLITSRPPRASLSHIQGRKK